MPELVKKMKVPVMKVGKHIAADGTPVVISDKDLDDMIANLSGDIAAGYMPPIVLGHPKMDEPRYGDFLALQKENGVLLADFGVIPELDAQLVKGQWPARSLRLGKKADGTYNIRHLGLLGVVPPAVKGLPAYCFAEGDDPDQVTIDFSGDYRMSVVGRIFRRVREYFIEKEGAEAADRLVGNWEIEELERESSAGEPDALAFNQSEKEDEMSKEEEAKTKLAAAEGQLADFAKNDREQKERIRVLEAEGRQRDFSAFCEGLRKEGKLSPKMVSSAMDFMEILSGVETFDFSEGDEKKAAAPVEKFKELLSAYPKLVEFSEVATKDKAKETIQGTAGEKLDTLAREKMKTDGNLTYSAAFSAVQSEHIDLAAEYAAEVRK